MSTAPLSPGEQPRTKKKSHAGVITFLVIVALVWLFDRCTSLPYDDNERVGKSIVVAVESFRAKNGHFPGSLEELVPTYLPAVPQAGKWFPVYYAVDPGGAHCWVGYGVHRDRVEEYDCHMRQWINYEYGDEQRSQHLEARVQYLESEMMRKSKAASGAK